MEITFESIVSLVSLLVGGSGLGVFFTWQYMRRKAAADAATAEAEAEKAKYEASQAHANVIKAIQDSYQQLLGDMKSDHDEQRGYIEEQKKYIAELRDDRMQLRKERDELRDGFDRLAKEFADFKRESEAERDQMKRDIARNGRMVESMRPLLCGKAKCKDRTNVDLSQITTT